MTTLTTAYIVFVLAGACLGMLTTVLQHNGSYKLHISDFFIVGVVWGWYSALIFFSMACMASAGWLVFALITKQ